MRTLRFIEFKNNIEMGAVGDLVDTLNSGVSVNSYDSPIEDENNIGILKTSAISNGFFLVNENKKVIESDLQRVKNSLTKDSILVSRMNTPALVGQVGYIDKDYSNLYVPDRLWVLKTKDKCSPKWLTYMLLTPRVKNAIRNRATGTSATMKNISKPSFLNIKIPIPDYSEQIKVADFLSSVDNKISLLKQKHTLITNYKKGVMKKLFNQEIRFNDNNGNSFPDWEVRSLGELFSHHNEKNNDESNRLLSVRMHDGVMPRDEISGKDNSSEDKSNYLKVDVDDIVYNSMRMWQGASGLSLYSGIVSPAYTVVSPKKDSYGKFFSYFFKYSKTVNLFRRNSQGLTSDTWNLKYPQFSKIKVCVPEHEEQKTISKFFESLDKKLEIVSREIELTQTFKKGLLQQMFV